MKRSSALAPLSRDHHHALVVAASLLAAEPDEAADAAERFVSFLEQHEIHHFQLEEEVLLPALPASPKAGALAERVRDEHGRLRALMERLRGADTNRAQLLKEAGLLLRAHVRLEERELFPLLEEALERNELEELGRRIARRA